MKDNTAAHQGRRRASMKRKLDAALDLVIEAGFEVTVTEENRYANIDALIESQAERAATRPRVWIA